MINSELLDEIKEFCKLNELELEDTVNKVLRGGFTTFKYGSTPISAKRENKPVEIIKTVEVIKEVEIIKEVPVEKIVKVSDNTKVNELLKEISDCSKKLSDCSKNLLETEKEYDKKIKALEMELKKKNNNNKDIYGEDD